MISTILNELSVQIVSDPFPKPKPLQASQCQSPCTNQFQAFRSFLFSDFNHRAQNTNTKLTGILFLSFHPKPVLKQITITANTNADTKQIKATTKTTDSKLKAYAGQAVPPTAPIPPAPRPSSSRAPTCRSYSTRTTRSPSSRPEPQRSDQVARGAA